MCTAWVAWVGWAKMVLTLAWIGVDVNEESKPVSFLFSLRPSPFFTLVVCARTSIARTARATN
jgi:hypothetical protein